MNNLLYQTVLNSLAQNTKLTQLLSLLIYSYKLDDVPFPDTEVDWEEFRPGRKIKITWSDPYKVEYGFIFTLPGFCDDILKGGLVQIPESEDDSNIQRWYVLKHLAIFATLELEPEL